MYGCTTATSPTAGQGSPGGQGFPTTPPAPPDPSVRGSTAAKQMMGHGARMYTNKVLFTSVVLMRKSQLMIGNL